jgi:hypothetical protein
MKISVEKLIEQYVNYMEELKSRVAVVSSVVEHKSKSQTLTGFRESDIELCFLQLRKCLELMMFASVSANYHAGLELQRHIVEGEWNATKLVKMLARHNPKFYPQAMEPPIEIEPGKRHAEEKKSGYLTKDEFCVLYDRVCGPLMHASRKPQFVGRYDELFTEIQQWRDKLVGLLNHHWIYLTEEVRLAALMKTTVNGAVQVVLMKKVG